MEYGLLRKDEMDEMKQELYMKTQNLINLESNINYQKVIGKEVIRKWTNDLKQIREFYAEILIHYLYFHQDNEILKKIVGIYNFSDEKKIVEDSKFFDFSNSILFEKEFSKKLNDFFLGYVLSQNSVIIKIKYILLIE